MRQTRQRPQEKEHKDKHKCAKHRNKTKDRVTRNPTKTGFKCVIPMFANLAPPF
jgi:hypothetical protein